MNLIDVGGMRVNDATSQSDIRVMVQTVNCGTGRLRYTRRPPASVRPRDSLYPHHHHHHLFNLGLKHFVFTEILYSSSSHQNPSTPPNLKNNNHKHAENNIHSRYPII